MTDDPPSRLLADLAAGAGESAWRELDARYRSALVGFAARLGASVTDAEEIAQDALAAFARACRAGTYDPRAGSLSGWLYALVRDRVRQHWRWRAVRAGERGESALGDVEDETRLSGLWEHEWRAAILREALRRLREESGFSAKTLAAFEALALEGREAADVGRQLGMTANAVYQAKFRASERLRELVSALERADVVEPAAVGTAEPGPGLGPGRGLGEGEDEGEDEP